MDGEAARIHTQSHGVVDENQCHQQEQDSQAQQQVSRFVQVAVKVVNQVFLIDNIRDEFVFLQLFANPQQAVGTGIVCSQV